MKVPAERFKEWSTTLREWAKRHRHTIAQVLVLVAILGFLQSFKISYTEHQDRVNIDGGYYTTIAVHVRDGLGLKTNVSLYHQAFSYFPHETPVSPLWPLTYGFAAKWFPLFDVAFWLPTLLYFAALILAYLWGSTLLPEDLFPRALPGFNAGHVLVLMLGLHLEFFIFTSLPYTEGLAYTLLFAGLWRFATIFHRLEPRHGLEMGVWLAVIMLARAQLVLAAIATVMALAWAAVAVKPRKRHALVLLGCITTFAAIIGSYYVFFLRDFVGNSMIAALLRFDQAYETSLLSDFKPIMKMATLKDYVLDRWKGVEIAYKLEGRYAYKRSFYLFHYAVPVALPFLVFYALRSLRRDRLRAIWSWLRSSESLRWIFVVLFALGGFVSLHMIHKSYFSAWHFPRRQGLTALFIFFLAMLFLLRRRTVAPALGVFLLCSSLYLGYRAIDNKVEHAEKTEVTSPAERRKALVKWLRERRQAEGDFVVAMAAQEPQQIAFMTPRIGYHWIYAKTRYEDLQKLVDELGVRYVLLTGAAHRWRIARDKRFLEDFRRVAKVSGVSIYAPR